MYQSTCIHVACLQNRAHVSWQSIITKLSDQQHVQAHDNIFLIFILLIVLLISNF